MTGGARRPAMHGHEAFWTIPTRPPNGHPAYQYSHDWHDYLNFGRYAVREGVCHFMNCFLDSDYPPCIHSKKEIVAGKAAFD
jgi:hypothetical protein